MAIETTLHLRPLALRALTAVDDQLGPDDALEQFASDLLFEALHCLAADLRVYGHIDLPAIGRIYGWRSPANPPAPLEDVLITLDGDEGPELNMGFITSTGQWRITDSTAPTIAQPIAWEPLPNPAQDWRDCAGNLEIINAMNGEEA